MEWRKSLDFQAFSFWSVSECYGLSRVLGTKPERFLERFFQDKIHYPRIRVGVRVDERERGSLSKWNEESLPSKGG
jgi:hypothetical protein